MRNWLKKWLISYLSEELSDYTTPQKSDFEKLMKVIQVGDVILVEGKQRVSKIIKYLTQSNWSHVAFYIGNGELIEADLKEGVRVVSVKEYANYHTRICRPKELKIGRAHV